MTESTTIEAPPAAPGVTRVTVEEDASPVVRLIGRTLRGTTAGLTGTVVVRSHDTPQVATVVLSGDVVEVSAGVVGEPDASVVVDLHARFAPTEEPIGDAALAAALLRALRPALPHWRDAARRFWETTRAIPGMPEVLVVEALGPDGPERARLGEGTTSYLLSGPADLLSGVLSGADDLLAALGAGLRVQGSLAQLSVMTAASWKVRLDV